MSNPESDQDDTTKPTESKCVSGVCCGIYKIVNLQTECYYVGSSKDILRRWKDHKLALTKGKHHSPYLQRAWDKYGEKSFGFVVVEHVAEDRLLMREQEYLDVARTTRERSYNASFHAIGGCDEELKEKLRNRWTSEMKKERADMLTGSKNPFWKRNHNAETKKLLSKLHTGRVHTKEHVQKRIRYGTSNGSTDLQVYIFENKRTGERFEGLRIDFGKAYPSLVDMCGHWIRSGCVGRTGWTARPSSA